MQCVNCGRPLRPHETLCPFCGEPVVTSGTAADLDTVPAVQATPAPGQMVHPSGPPVDPFAPTIYGPPIGPERYARVYSPMDEPTLQRIQGYRVISAPRPPDSARRTGCLRGLAVVASLAMLLLLAGGALAATGHNLPGLSPLLSQSQPRATATVRPSPTPACPAPALSAQAAQALDQVALTTGVADAALKPKDQVYAFTPGQTVHVVFHIRTPSAGTISATFCLNGALSVSNTPLFVPAGYATRLGPNARGQFYLKLEPTNVGPGLITLRWNGQVAAEVPFTVHAA